MNQKQIDKFIKIIQKNNTILIIIKGSPDPDALASSYALYSLALLLGKKAEIVSFMHTSLPQNRAFIKKIGIPVHHTLQQHYENYSGYAVLDHQSAWVEEIDTKIPCLIHIDHHSPEEDKIKPLFKYISEETGSVSSIFTLIMKEHSSNEILSKLITITATALYYGIKIDTDDFKNATKKDTEAAEWLQQFTDLSVIDEIETMPFSDETITVISKAIMNRITYKDWLFCGVGFLQENFRDSIAIAADYLLKTESVFAIAVFACIEKKQNKGLFLDVSIRTTDRYYDLNKFIKSITPGGGARSFKGAYQVYLDYFSDCPDKASLWDLIQSTTHVRLSQACDKYPSHSLKTAFSRLLQNVRRIFSGHDTSN
jgi:nanoRNase/pAp phosphatase (c-di-AMP/oligoRNAs hydrolase)